MKRKNLFLIVLLAIATIFCIAACGANPNHSGGEDDPSDTNTYEITVDTTQVAVDTSDISVCLYALDGTAVGEKKLSQGKAEFELDDDTYVATLSGLSEEVSYSSVLLTSDNRKATIALEESRYISERNLFAFTVILFAEDRDISDLDVQVCDDALCMFVPFDNGNASDLFLSSGEYEVKVNVYSEVGAEEIYHKDHTVTLEKRFCIILLYRHEHVFGDYDILSAAGCETDGEQVHTCSVCGYSETEVIPASGHDWSEFAITIPAKCGIKGEKTRSCETCKEVERVEISALEHVWTDEVILEQPTCVDEGLRSVRCELCGTTLSADVIPATGHTRGTVIPATNPTCEEPGLTMIFCKVCGKRYDEYPPATGHNYSEEFTVDKLPTIDEEGERSRHCTNANCTSRTDIQPIPRLINEAYFRICIVRGENQKILPTTYNPRIKIVDESGKQVASDFVWGNANGEHIYQILLPFGTYTVTITNELPTGFECGTYTISEQDGIYPYDTPERYPTITMHLYSHLGEGSMASGDKKNTVLNDFSVTTIDGVTVTLSELLAQKKLVWLNFYYNDCNPCQAEASEIVRIAQLFDVAVICFNNRDSVEEMRNGAKNIFKFPDSFYLVQDSGDAFGKLFGRYAYPMNVFIDSGGCVFESVTGSNYSSQFYQFVSQNLFETPQREAVAFAQPAAILPKKQRYLYSVEVAR